MSTTAAAPSEVCELLPAVMLPFAANTGFSFASASGEVSRRGPSSCTISRAFTRTSRVARSGMRSLTASGVTSSLNSPVSVARIARRWLSAAKRSCSSRLTFHCVATFSAVTPMP